MARTLKEVVQGWVVEWMSAAMNEAVAKAVTSDVAPLIERVAAVEDRAAVDLSGFVTAEAFAAAMQERAAGDVLPPEDREILEWMRPTYLAAKDPNAAADDPIVLTPV